MEETREQVKVWDWQERVIHWGLAISVILLAVLGIFWEVGKDLGMPKEGRRVVKEVHSYIGYLLALFFTLRVVRGFTGNKYAKWGDIFPHTKEQFEGIKANVRWFLGGFRGLPPQAVGHNPLASHLYIVLSVVLVSQMVTGFILSGLEFNMFPGSIVVGGMGEEARKALKDGLKEVHEFGLIFTLVYLALHLGGNVIHDIKEKNGLMSSMISGVKYLRKKD